MLLSGAPPFNGDSSEKIHHLILVSTCTYTVYVSSLFLLNALYRVSSSHSSYLLSYFIIWSFSYLLLFFIIDQFPSTFLFLSPVAFLQSLSLLPTFLNRSFNLFTFSFLTSFSSSFFSLTFSFSITHNVQHKEPDYSSKMFPKALDSTIDFLKQVTIRMRLMISI